MSHNKVGKSTLLCTTISSSDHPLLVYKDLHLPNIFNRTNQVWFPKGALEHARYDHGPFCSTLEELTFLVVGLCRCGLQVPCNLWKRCLCWKEFWSDAIGIFARTSSEALFEIKSESLLNSWNLFSGFMNQNIFWYINNLGKHVLIALRQVTMWCYLEKLFLE